MCTSWRFGRGRPVLFVHGGGGFAAQWTPLMAAMQAEHRLLAVDRPGFGLTERFSYDRALLEVRRASARIAAAVEGLRTMEAAIDTLVDEALRPLEATPLQRRAARALVDARFRDALAGSGFAAQQISATLARLLHCALQRS